MKPRARAELAALIGHPVAQSLSPAIFDFLSARTGRRVEYMALDVTPSGLGKALESLCAAGFAGVNVTAPLKERALRLADRVSGEARAIGAVNVLHFDRGRVFGRNTDAGAFLDALSDGGVKVAGKEAVVFGAGGAARAVCWALDSAGARKVHVVNRTRRKAEELVKELTRRCRRTTFEAHGWGRSRGSFGTSGLYINATPVGMEGRVGASRSFPLEKAKGTAFAFDLVYRPAETPFLRQAGRLGMRTIPGLGMLIGQALATWELWFGALPGKSRLKGELERRLLSGLSSSRRESSVSRRAPRPRVSSRPR